MNFDILKIIQLVFAVFDDTEIRNNKTFQIARDVVNAVQPSQSIHQSQDACRTSHFSPACDIVPTCDLPPVTCDNSLTKERSDT